MGPERTGSILYVVEGAYRRPLGFTEAIGVGEAQNLLDLQIAFNRGKDAGLDLGRLAGFELARTELHADEADVCRVLQVCLADAQRRGQRIKTGEEGIISSRSYLPIA